MVLGHENVGGVDSVDIALLKLDSLGNLLWRKTYQFPGISTPYDICETQDNGFIISGVYYTYNPTTINPVILKTDSIGTVEWSNKYSNSTGFTAFIKLHELNSGNIILVGITNTVNSQFDLLVVKLDTNGNIINSNTIGTSNDESVKASYLTTNEELLICGESFDTFSCASWDSYAIRVDTLGTIIWNKVFLFDSCNVNEATSIIEDNFGDIYLGVEPELGWTWGSALIKFNNSGNIIWMKGYPKIGIGWITNLTNSNSGLIMLNWYNDTINGAPTNNITEIDIMGNILWSTYFSDGTISKFRMTDFKYRSIQNDISMCGTKIPFQSGDNAGDYYCHKFGINNINQLCQSSIALIDEMNYTVNMDSGLISQPINSISYNAISVNEQIALLNTYPLCISTNIIENNLPSGLDIYPNPIQNSVTINLLYSQEVIITDMLGRLVYINYFETFGDDKTQIDLSKLKSGMYSISINNKTLKLIKI